MSLASIQKIHNIAPHPDPEVTRLQVAKIFEWPVVIEKDKHREGELVVFIEIDSIVPERPEFEFMRSRKFRIYNAKFKSAPSSGLVMPLDCLNSFGKLFTENGKIFLEISDDTRVFGVNNIECNHTIQT